MKNTGSNNVPVREEKPFDEKRRKEMKTVFALAAGSAGAALAFQLRIINLGNLTELFKDNPEAAIQKLQSGIQAATGITNQGYQFPGLGADPSGLAGGFQYYNSATGQMHFQDGYANANRTVNAWKDSTGAPFVTVSPVGTAQGYPKNNGGSFGPDTAGTLSGGLNEAIATGKDVYMTGLITTTVTITGFSPGQTLRGTGWAEATGTTNFLGSGIYVSTPNINAIDLSSILSPNAVSLQDFQIAFNPASGSGHAIYANPGAVPGMLAPYLRNLCVVNGDANHYAVYVVNVQRGKFDHIHSSGGTLGLYFGETAGAGQAGNSLFTNCRFFFATAPYGGPMVNLNATHSMTYLEFVGLQAGLGLEATQYAIALTNVSSSSFHGVTGDSSLTASNPNAINIVNGGDLTFINVSINPSGGKTPQYVVNGSNRVYLIDVQQSGTLTQTNSPINIYVIGGTLGITGSSGGVAKYQREPGFNFTGTPGLPGGIGSGNAVTNTNSVNVMVFLPFSAGGSAFGTHVIDTRGGGNSDKALPSDPTMVVLRPGCQIYFATFVPASWLWYGTDW